MMQQLLYVSVLSCGWKPNMKIIRVEF